jgi:thioredoxin-like negative regulator of GroEL
MESVLDQVGRKERHRIDVVRIEVDEQPELAARLRVTEAPALVLVREKRVVARLDGRVSATKIEAFLELHLAVTAAS